jgi:hypothetical protein
MLYLEKHPHSPGRVVAKSEVITNPEGVGGPRGLVLVSRAGSEGRRNTCAQFTRWSLKAQSFSRALI